MLCDVVNSALCNAYDSDWPNNFLSTICVVVLGKGHHPLCLLFECQHCIYDVSGLLLFKRYEMNKYFLRNIYRKLPHVAKIHHNCVPRITCCKLQ